MRLADELLLLAYSDEGDAQLGASSLNFGLSGAVLLELALAGRFDVDGDDKIVVTDATPTGDPVLDETLSTVANDKKTRTPRDWLSRLPGDKLHQRLLDDLVAAGVLTREQDKVLWVFPRTRYPSAHGVQPPQETDARARLNAALDGPDPVDPRTSALAALVQAAGLSGKVFDGRKGRDVKRRIQEMSEASVASGQWASEGVRKAIEQVEAALITTMIATTVVTTTTTNN
ncbi:hypothetical protein GCM10009557_21540 [Virgisporangium ochraceum]|uniref:Golgi phosphoprotein 3 n=1 Tax=Virgisporangium ochraceum TaxID=65505 RepID=A0A8J4E8N5_9ACTN|nr:GPP34 family phosphoprotein [Virgisporangium ochraceum]GIJ66355.1 hypothetical protein Voc01_012720 [Virgisporangium ochraceum]